MEEEQVNRLSFFDEQDKRPKNIVVSIIFGRKNSCLRNSSINRSPVSFIEQQKVKRL